MRVTLDTQEMRSNMELWRDTLVLCRPEAQRSSELRAIQLKMLKELDCTLTGWLDLLQMCSAKGSDLIELQNIRIEVSDGKAWVTDALAAIRLNDAVQVAHERSAAIVRT